MSQGELDSNNDKIYAYPWRKWRRETENIYYQ